MGQPFSVTNNSAAATAESRVEAENTREKTALLQERKA